MKRVVVRAVSNEATATVLVDHLRSVGIDAVFEGAMLAAAASPLATGGGIQILVPESQQKQAEDELRRVETKGAGNSENESGA